MDFPLARAVVYQPGPVAAYQLAPAEDCQLDRAEDSRLARAEAYQPGPEEDCQREQLPITEISRPGRSTSNILRSTATGAPTRHLVRRGAFNRWKPGDGKPGDGREVHVVFPVALANR